MNTGYAGGFLPCVSSEAKGWTVKVETSVIRGIDDVLISTPEGPRDGHASCSGSSHTSIAWQ